MKTFCFNDTKRGMVEDLLARAKVRMFQQGLIEREMDRVVTLDQENLVKELSDKYKVVGFFYNKPTLFIVILAVLGISTMISFFGMFVSGSSYHTKVFPVVFVPLVVILCALFKVLRATVRREWGAADVRRSDVLSVRVVLNAIKTSLNAECAVVYRHTHPHNQQVYYSVVIMDEEDIQRQYFFE